MTTTSATRSPPPASISRSGRWREAGQAAGRRQGRRGAGVRAARQPGVLPAHLSGCSCGRRWRRCWAPPTSSGRGRRWSCRRPPPAVGRTHYLRARLHRDGERLIATPHARQGSHMRPRWSGSTRLVELDAARRRDRAGRDRAGLLLRAV
ncbi:MAG: hypothetical protein HS111_29080 [Kofleriaceae bacterium]|nr:hypothetical protein [Kofleriaceae bacterium]